MSLSICRAPILQPNARTCAFALQMYRSNLVSWSKCECAKLRKCHVNWHFRCHRVDITMLLPLCLPHYHHHYATSSQLIAKHHMQISQRLSVERLKSVNETQASALIIFSVWLLVLYVFTFVSHYSRSMFGQNSFPENSINEWIVVALLMWIFYVIAFQSVIQHMRFISSSIPHKRTTHAQALIQTNSQ